LFYIKSHIKAFRKYLFGLVVSVYTISVIGIPVYFHYCGGELEEVNYVVKGSSCCGDQEDNEDNGCCKDEGLVLQSSTDFTIKEIHNFDFVKTFCELHYVSLPFSIDFISEESIPTLNLIHSPPKLQINEVISTTVLRI
jgi:hypothetical protein